MRNLGVSTVVAYLFVFVISLSLLSIVYVYVTPLFADYKSQSEFEYMIIQLQKIDDKVRIIARGGLGSRDSLSMSLSQGAMEVADIGDRIDFIIASNRCLSSKNVSGFFYEFVKIGGCQNKVILNYTNVNITNNGTFQGSFRVTIENLGFSNNKPLIKVS